MITGLVLLLAALTQDAMDDRGRPDPFERPRPANTEPPGVPPATDDPPAPPKPEPVPTAFADALARGRELSTQLRVETADDRVEAAAKTYQSLLAVYRNLSGRTQGPIQKSEVEKFKVDAEKYYGGAALRFVDAKQCMDRLEDAFAASHLAKVDLQLAKLNNLKECNEFFNDDHAPLLAELIAAGKAKRDRIAIRIELSNKSITLSGTTLATEEVRDRVKVGMMVGGSRVDHEEPVIAYRHRSFAVVTAGGVTDCYAEGETIPGTGVRIARIRSNSIEVSFKGERREIIGLK